MPGSENSPLSHNNNSYSFQFSGILYKIKNQVNQLVHQTERTIYTIKSPQIINLKIAWGNLKNNFPLLSSMVKHFVWTSARRNNEYVATRSV